MKFMLVVLASLLPAVAYSIGEGGDTEWLKGAAVEVQLSLSATVGTNGQVKVSGDLHIKNPGTAPLTIQNPHNRQVLAFLVFDPLGNPVAPVLRGKADPGFDTYTLSPCAIYTHGIKDTHGFKGLDFVTGSAWLGYDLIPGKLYRVVAIYRPAGPHGPGFASQETILEIPKEPQVVRDLRAQLPGGWNCTVYQEDDVRVVPHGLGKPLFQVVASNANLSFVKFPDAPRPTMQSPVIPLYFYRHSEKADIMKIIEKESSLSWSIPIYFGETDEFVVVTSPAFVNGGLFTPEARHALRPMWKVLRDLIPKREKTGVDVDDLAADN